MTIHDLSNEFRIEKLVKELLNDKVAVNIINNVMDRHILLDVIDTLNIDMYKLW